MSTSQDSFGARSALAVGGRELEIFRLGALAEWFEVERLPFSLKVLLENLLRHEDGLKVTADDVEALAGWRPGAEPHREIAYTPARVLMQDFTGVPAVVDLAAMREALAELGGDPARINPLKPAELVIDHSIVADVAGVPGAFLRNAELEFERNRERYQFLRWGQEAFDSLAVVPPNTGICHQVNLEYLARVVCEEGGTAFPDTLVGTDSHTTMINGLGVLGWGVGGIEAEAVMLGQPMSMLIPQVVGFRLTGELREGSTATDLVLTVTQMLRERGVVGRFVEFYGPGLEGLPLADRATIGNMSPEFGSTCAIFPIDAETLRYLEFTGRPPEALTLVEAYAREQGLFHEPGSHEPAYSDTLELDLGTVVPSLAGPKRPQDRVPLTEARESLRVALAGYGIGDGERAAAAAAAEGELSSVDESSAESFPASDPPAPVAGGSGEEEPGGDGGGGAGRAAGGGGNGHPGTAVEVRLADGTAFPLDHGHVVIAAITSCTNTSNPSVMLAAALLARNAAQRGLKPKPWVKTSLAPGSKVVTDYYERAGLTRWLDELGFNLVGYGCTTCIGNSGPLAPEVSEAIERADLAVCSVLSGNRNFEGRINPDAKLNYLASPPLVVAYALAGTLEIDLLEDPLGEDADGGPVYLRELWPSSEEVKAVVADSIRSEMFNAGYADVFAGDESWNGLEIPGGEMFEWDPGSTYVRRPPFFEGMARDPESLADVRGARVLALLGDSVTTDHISPAGAIKRDSPAGRYLVEHGVEPRDFNSYGSRRGNHEVMMRGTFANIRLRNLLLPGSEGGVTVHLPAAGEGGEEEQLPIYEAAMRYRDEGVPLVVLAGREYGSGSSRDWAAKGTRLLGVRAVLAESFERIHRSNLVGMGVLPLQLPEGESAESLGLTGRERFDVLGLEEAGDELPEQVTVRAGSTEFQARLRIDTPTEADYFRHGGILHYVLRTLL